VRKRIRVRKADVSVVVNTFNEEARLPACLESVRWADDIVVVDMHSDDRTAQIAADFGCRVFQHERTSYVEPARNFALAQARHSWALVLDADESASPGLSTWINEKLPSTNAAAFRIPRRNFYRGQWLTCCGWFPDEQLRLFRRDCVSYSERIHRAPDVNGTIETLPLRGDAFIAHAAFDSLQSRFEKTAKYAAISGQAMFKEGRRTNAFSIVGATAAAFLTAYFLQGGIWYGGLGAVLSLERAMAVYFKYASLWEQQRQA
jgi:glycosyltransferase involved in cell wall biosynthesis